MIPPYQQICCLQCWLELRAAKTADGKPVMTEAQMKKAFEPGRLTKPESLKL